MARGFIRTGGRAMNLRPLRAYRIRSGRPGIAPRPPWAGRPIRPGGHGPGRRPIRSGRFHRVAWPVGFPIVVVDALAEQLNAVLEEFAQATGTTTEAPLKIVLRPGTLGLHRAGRAVDIYGIGGKGIGRWATEWNAAHRKAAASKDPAEQARIIEEEKTKNLGYKLYKALQARGGWARPQGYPVQLFGPWTRGEGPHKAISDKLLRLHRDHIHVAK
jgi:hypothetical protein